MTKGLLTKSEYRDLTQQMREKVCWRHRAVKIKNMFGEEVCVVCMVDDARK